LVQFQLKTKFVMIQLNNIKKLKTFNINFGPQHPAAHGVLRFSLGLSKKVIFYGDVYIGLLHWVTKKFIEYKTINQALPYFDRLGYVFIMFQEYVFFSIIEKYFNRLKLVKRVQYILILFNEIIQRFNYLMLLKIHVIGVGGWIPFLRVFEEREKLMEFYERVSGARMHAIFTKFGRMSKDLSLGLLINFYNRNLWLIKEIYINLLTKGRILNKILKRVIKTNNYKNSKLLINIKKSFFSFFHRHFSDSVFDRRKISVGKGYDIIVKVIWEPTHFKYGLLEISEFCKNPIYILCKKVEKFNGFGIKGLNIFHSQSVYNSLILNHTDFTSLKGLQKYVGIIDSSLKKELIDSIDTKLIDDEKLREVLFPYYWAGDFSLIKKITLTGGDEIYDHNLNPYLLRDWEISKFEDKYKYLYLKFFHPYYGTYLRTTYKSICKKYLVITNGLLLVEKSPGEPYNYTYEQMEEIIDDITNQYIKKNSSFRIIPKKNVLK
jgi:hypothetical protein